MKTKKPILFDDFATLCGSTIEVKYSDVIDQFYACFAGAEVISPGFLTAVCGYGKTRNEAKKDYVTKIAGKRIVFDAFKPERREYVVPENLAFK
jgi:hypothetical protein